MIARTHKLALLSLCLGCSLALAQEDDGLQLSSRENASATRPQSQPEPERAVKSILERPAKEALPLKIPGTAPASRLKPADLRPSNALAQYEQKSAAARASQDAEAEQPQGELVRQRFANGKPQIERWVIEDGQGNIVNHGSYIQFDPQGVELASGQYVYGQQVGEWSRRVTAEQAQRLAGVLDPEFVAPFLSKATFANGQLVGEWTLCDAQERPVFVWSFLAGKRHGLSTHFDSRGEVVQSIPYEHNVAHGAARLAAVGDNSPPEQQVLRGKMLRRADKWYPSVAGKQRVLKAQEWQLAPMALNPVAHDWNASSVEYQQPDEAETVRHGLSVTFFPNGQRESEGNYEQGKRSGTFAWWYSNGQQRTVGEYRNDAEHSEWTWWHENGMKQAVGMFAEGTRIDEWSVWNEEGKLVQRATPKPESQVAEREAPLAETQR